MKNTWIIPIIEEWEEKEKHGKMQLNFKNGIVPAINIEESIQKPKEIKVIDLIGNA